MNVLMILMLAMAIPETVSPPSLDDMLTRTAKSVDRFWSQFSAVNCVESVQQEKLGKEGKSLYKHESTFDYLIFMNLQGEDLNIEESRILQKEAGKSSNLPLLMTSGFSTLLLVFHPYYQGSFEYQKLEDDSLEGRRMIRIAFRHLHGTRSTAAIRLRGNDYPLDLQGIAWINPSTWVVEKIEAHLESPMDDLNLKKFSTLVKYAPQVFPASTEAEWLPAEATIDVETAKQHWRNIHRFQNYRHFSVNAESVVSK